MKTTKTQMYCPYGTPRELPTTGLGARGLALLSMIDGYLENYQRNGKCYPPAISLNQKQWNELTKSTQLTGLELSEFTYRGINFHLIKESPQPGRSGHTSQF